MHAPLWRLFLLPARALVRALVLAGSLFGAAGAMAQPAGTLRVAPIAYTERVLPNGLQVIAAESHASPTVAVQVWYHVGAKDDPAGRSGFAHLFEHLMFKRTRYLQSEQFDRLTEDVGGSNNAFTSEDVTAYHAVVPSNHLQTLLWAEAERMSNLRVDEASFQSERAVVQEEYRQSVLAAPYGRLYNALAPAAYREHPYQRPTIGSIADLDAATLANVVAFHNAYYRPDNATLVVTGDFDPAQLQAWVDQYFGALVRPAPAVPRMAAAEPAWPADRVSRVTGPKVPLPAVALLWLAPPVTSPDMAALRVAAALLAGGQSSRLNQTLVYRRRMASEVGFDADLRAGPGLLVATAIAADKQPLPALQAALLAAVLQLARQPPSAAELAKVKLQLLTQALTERQTPMGLATALAAAAVLEGGAAQANRSLDALQAVTAADVQRVLRQYLVGPHRVTVQYTQQAGVP